MLTGRKEDECFCSSGHIKCWWHGLKDVKVSSTRKADENIDIRHGKWTNALEVLITTLLLVKKLIKIYQIVQKITNQFNIKLINLLY